MEHSKAFREALRDGAVRDERHGVDRNQSYSKPVKGGARYCWHKGTLDCWKVAGAAPRACLLTKLSELPAGRLLVYSGVTVGTAGWSAGCLLPDGVEAITEDDRGARSGGKHV